MWKTTYREIRQSFGRYAAILAIVALGVGFFVGLMVVTPAMVRNGGRYLNSHDLYDLRLLSTLGFEKDSVDAFTGREDIKAVEGAVSSDFLAVDESGKSRVLVAQTLLEVQNQVELKAGRLPEAADEIVVDSSLFSKDDIGKTIQVSDENSEETADLFAYDVYTIVGIADASYYINYQRGSTTLGTGRVSGFVYMLPDGFDTDYYIFSAYSPCADGPLLMPRRRWFSAWHPESQASPLRSAAILQNYPRHWKVLTSPLKQRRLGSRMSTSY